MNEYPNTLKRKLSSIISKMAESPELYVKNPEKDFTRTRKLPFDAVMQLLIAMGGDSIYKELLEAHGYDIRTSTSSAFIQQRDKILPFAFESLLNNFTESYSEKKKYEGYRLLAADGSVLHIPTNQRDADTHFKSHEKGNGYNLLHLNALYDLCNKLYVDVLIQSGRDQNENKALVDMIDRSNIKGNVIVIADRGYEGYNNFAHIEQRDWKYLIRVKDVDRKRNGLLCGLPLPTKGAFDISIKRTLTKKQTNEVRARPDIYKYLHRTFDYLDLHTNQFYPISFRVVRFKVADGFYETVVTNLDAPVFTPKKLKKLYKMRWGVETSFRELKYTVGLTCFHAKKKEYILQEIFARIIMYNFAAMVAIHVIILQKDTRYYYQVNFAIAFFICRRFLLHWHNTSPPDVEEIIGKNILPVRPGRNYERNVQTGRTAVSFNYRV